MCEFEKLIDAVKNKHSISLIEGKNGEILFCESYFDKKINQRAAVKVVLKEKKRIVTLLGDTVINPPPR